MLWAIRSMISGHSTSGARACPRRDWLPDGPPPATTACAFNVTTPDLEATQRIPSPYEDAQPQRPHGLQLGGFGRALLILILLIGAFFAAALLLTPPRESILILGSDARPDEIKRGEAGRTDTLLLLVADRAAPRLA